MSSLRERIAALQLLVVVPTYNNDGTLSQVIAEVKAITEHLLVVNDGSTDADTKDIIAAHQVAHITYTPNRGKGYAIQAAFQYALQKGYRYILTIDSDGQHYPEDILHFVDKIEENPDMLIIGARNLQAENMPSKNTFANKFSNFWFKVETGQTLTDTQSGFRLYPVKRMGGMRFFSNRYEFEVEVIVRAAWKGITVCNIPIQVYYPPADERVSHFKPLKDFTRISILNTFLVIVALLYYYPWKALHALTRENVKKFIKNNITESKESNGKIAGAMGLGFFFGIFPIWGYQMLVAALVAHLLRLNKVLTLIASNISIPPMIPFILYGSYWTGGLLLGKESRITFSNITLEKASEDLMQYLLGATVFAITAGVAMFCLSFLFLSLVRKRKNG